MDQQKRTAQDAINEIAGLICEMSDAIWGTPELAYHETRSAQLQLDALKALGFDDIRTNLVNIPTAFSARWGSGKPVIGILGEFDALSGLSQKANCAVREPITENGDGHGCGHNLLGAGSMAAAYAVKEYLKASGKPGTVIYYGCPGEEGGSAKSFMTRDGVFDELDAALCWHPAASNSTWTGSKANFSVRYSFKGVSSHASAAPHLGRSALDAVELMNVGVQFLREHVPTDVRMHYAITDAGGVSPNVVQPKAEVLYVLRADSIAMVQEIYERVNNIARGAALMTGTEVNIRFIKSAANLLTNWTLNRVLHENMEKTPLPELTQEDMDFAQSIYDTLEVKTDPYASNMPHLNAEQAAWLRQQPKAPVAHCVIPYHTVPVPSKGSTDVGDVSWVVPTAQIRAATWATATPAHSWQATAQGKSAQAHKYTLYAAKVLAGTAIDLINDPEIMAKAKEEHDESLGHKPFVSPIPKDVKPPID